MRALSLPCGLPQGALKVTTPSSPPSSSSASPQTVGGLAQAADEMEGKRLEDAQKEAEKVRQ